MFRYVAGSFITLPWLIIHLYLCFQQPLLWGSFRFFMDVEHNAVRIGATKAPTCELMRGPMLLSKALRLLYHCCTSIRGENTHRATVHICCSRTFSKGGFPGMQRLIEASVVHTVTLVHVYALKQTHTSQKWRIRWHQRPQWNKGTNDALLWQSQL